MDKVPRWGKRRGGRRPEKHLRQGRVYPAL